jgi:hypothetical protein
MQILLVPFMAVALSEPWGLQGAPSQTPQPLNFSPPTALACTSA